MCSHRRLRCVEPLPQVNLARKRPLAGGARAQMRSQRARTANGGTVRRGAARPGSGASGGLRGRTAPRRGVGALGAAAARRGVGALGAAAALGRHARRRGPRVPRRGSTQSTPRSTNLNTKYLGRRSRTSLGTTPKAWGLMRAKSPTARTPQLRHARWSGHATASPFCTWSRTAARMWNCS